MLLGKAVKTEHVGDAGKVPDPEHPLEHADPWGCTGRVLWEGWDPAVPGAGMGSGTQRGTWHTLCVAPARSHLYFHSSNPAEPDICSPIMFIMPLRDMQKS